MDMMQRELSIREEEREEGVRKLIVILKKKKTDDLEIINEVSENYGIRSI